MYFKKRLNAEKETRLKYAAQTDGKKQNFINCLIESYSLETNMGRQTQTNSVIVNLDVKLKSRALHMYSAAKDLVPVI